jgi:acyl-CoA thioester hydrolase
MSKVFVHKLRVRYGETDQMGFVYYGNYAQYLEVARTELIRSTGITYAELEKQGVQLPVVNLEINYRNPARYDDELRLETIIQGNISRKICFHTKIFKEDNTLLIEAMVELVFVNVKTEKVVRCPENLLNKLKEFQ